MGHYDSDREDRYDKIHKDKVKETQRLLKIIDQLQLDLVELDCPDRFVDSLQDLSNYLQVNYPAKSK